MQRPNSLGLRERDMKADKLTVNGLFDSNERREAPLFQRPYVWNEDENWEPLWQAIRSVADKRTLGAPVRPHFLGAVVLDQLRTPAGKLHARQIIDGQQRLTTLQLALAAARDLSLELGQARYSEAFRRLTDNDIPLSEDPDELFKVWPTNADRDEFRAIMSASSRAAVQALSLKGDALMRGGYLFFAEAFAGWLREAPTSDDLAARLKPLYVALREDLSLVAIDLDENDDAQEIFETLNALGTPLLPADLVKNYLFRLADAQGEDTEKLYVHYWSTFDSEKSYWRQEVRQGRLKRARLDLFFNHYLVLMKTKEIIISQMFLEYRDLVENGDAKSAAKAMALFRSYADVYQSFDGFPPASREGLFFRRLEDMDTTTVYPLLLEVFKRFSAPEKRQELDQILTDVESFLVRRTVCELTVKNYNRFFAELVKRLVDKDDFSAVAIREELSTQTADASRWPTDEEFGKAWATIEFYRRVKKSRQRMILEALNAALWDPKTERTEIKDKLTVEHLLPVSWEEHWPLIVRESTAEAQRLARERRGALLHRIGNLTLLTRELNPSVSNGLWLRKRDAILKHSALNLNRGFIDADTWGEDQIEERSEDLFKIAVKVWPHPGTSPV